MKKRKPAAVPSKPKKGPEIVSIDSSREVRTIARERVGRVKPSQTIQPKTARKKPKHKKALEEE